MSLKHAILGLLGDQPMHGYALKRALAPALGKDQLPNDGVLYPLLANLERAGFVRKKPTVSKAGRSRNVFSVTPKGKAELFAWLAGEAGEADEVTYDFFVGQPFLTKCLFFKHLSDDDVRTKLRSQRVSCREKLQLFQTIRATLVDRGVDRYRVAIIDLGIAQTRAKLRWLDAQLRELATQTEAA